MSNENTELKSFVKPNGGAVIVCPSCSGAQTISVRRFKRHTHSLNVKCKCGHSFKILLEFRRHFRKDTDLTATYDLVKPAVGGGIAHLVNLSLSGACFEIRGIHQLEVGQKGTIAFTLDNRKQTAMVKKLTIRTVVGNRIGCEFIEDKMFEKELGFYLLP